MTEQSVRTLTNKDIFEGIRDGIFSLNDFQYYMDIAAAKVAENVSRDIAKAINT